MSFFQKQCIGLVVVGLLEAGDRVLVNAWSQNRLHADRVLVDAWNQNSCQSAFHAGQFLQQSEAA